MTVTLATRFREAQGLVESNPALAVEKLEVLQKDVSSVALFSSNESMDDISNASLPLLALDFHLAMAYISIPTMKPKERKSNLIKATHHFSSFLERLSVLEVLEAEYQKEYEDLLQVNLDELASSTSHMNREAKIARFRAKKELQFQLDQLKSLRDRRHRLGLTDEEEMDGHDDDSLVRSLTLKSLTISSMESIEEWQQVIRELPMIEMQLKMEVQRASGDARRGGDSGPPPPGSQPPLQLTHITKDNMTGQLNIKKEEIRSQVFQPGWNQPTMSLEELGDREMNAAIAREAQQKITEEQNKHEPRRYEQLVKDGMEDNVELVEASAKLDRAWDDWKAENPTGSGNKMGDRGDRNF
jgi:immunoglobulin-binding protein 1